MTNMIYHFPLALVSIVLVGCSSSLKAREDKPPVIEPISLEMTTICNEKYGSKLKPELLPVREGHSEFDCKSQTEDSDGGLRKIFSEYGPKLNRAISKPEAKGGLKVVEDELKSKVDDYLIHRCPAGVYSSYEIDNNLIVCRSKKFTLPQDP
jgi:hypothetical protein